MDVRHLHLLLAVARERSFTRAARHAHLSQSALSQLVRRTENELGFEVFDRSVTPVDLTEAGREFIPRTQAVVQMYVDAVAAGRATTQTRAITVGAPPTLAKAVFPVLLDLLSPSDVLAPPRLVEATSSELADLVGRGLLDICLLSSGPASGANGLTFLPLASSNIVAVSSGEMDLGAPAGEDLTPSALAGRALLLPKAGGVRSHLTPYLTSLGQLRVAFESASIETLIGMAALGVGTALVPEMSLTPATRTKDSKLLVQRLVDGPTPVAIGLTERTGRSQPVDLQTVRTLLEQALVSTYPAFVVDDFQGAGS